MKYNRLNRTNRSRTRIEDLETVERHPLESIELDDETLRKVAGGLASSGGTCTTCNDCDC